MKNKKIRVLCVPSDTAGCGLHRSFMPHSKLHELYNDDFDVTIYYNFNWCNTELLNTYDIVHFHKGDYGDMEGFYKALDFCKENNIITIMDVDDNWDLNKEHPLYHMFIRLKMGEKITENLKRVDYVNTTTPIFAEKIKKYNPNVKVFPNAIDNNFTNLLKNNINKSGKIRIGFIMGSSHEEDMELVRGLVNRLPKKILNQIQIVLCGFDTRGTITIYNEDGGSTTRDIKPEESVWYRFEQNVTDNYKIVSPEHKDFLLKFIPQVEYPNTENESYKRCWTKPVDDYCYMEHYNNLDILLVPLAKNDFTQCKSELKFVEAGTMDVAVIASNTGPYTIGSENFFQKGGKINEKGNCILIDNRKTDKEWAKAIEKLVKTPEYIQMLKNNMAKHVKENYNLDKITAERAEWYKKICKRYGKEE